MIQVTGAQKLLELILLEKAALLRWLQEIEGREAIIRKWIEDERRDAAGDGVKEKP